MRQRFSKGMKYLIDTHILLWALISPERIPSRIIKALEKAEKVFVSSITFWEISLKYSIGKLNLSNITPEELPEISIKSGFNILEVDSKIMSAFHKLPRKSHKDPFDRMLIWVAIQNNLELISIDEHFSDYRENGLKLYR